LWFRGDAAALIEALTFGALLDFWLATGFLWTGWLEPRWHWALAGLLILWWAVGFWRNSRPQVLASTEPSASLELLLQRWLEARQAYLRSDWTEAERILRASLLENPRDPQSALLLARVLRRAGYLQEAQTELSRLRKLDEALPWMPEIEREKETIQRWFDDSQEEEDSAEPATISRSRNDSPRPQSATEQDETVAAISLVASGLPVAAAAGSIDDQIDYGAEPDHLSGNVGAPVAESSRRRDDEPREDQTSARNTNTTTVQADRKSEPESTPVTASRPLLPPRTTGGDVSERRPPSAEPRRRAA